MIWTNESFMPPNIGTFPFRTFSQKDLLVIELLFWPCKLQVQQGPFVEFLKQDEQSSTNPDMNEP